MVHHHYDVTLIRVIAELTSSVYGVTIMLWISMREGIIATVLTES